MGNTKSEELNQWSIAQKQNENFPRNQHIVRNSSGLLGELYQVQVPINDNFNQEIQTYKNRKNNKSKHLVSIHDFKEKDQFFDWQGSQKVFNVVAEYIPFRLNDAQNISTQQAAFLLNGSLEGFHQLRDENGSNFHINDKMIGVNQNGQVKVWKNQNFAVNQFNQQDPPELSEVNMIRQIIGAIKFHTPVENFQPIERSLKMNQPGSFTSAKASSQKILQTFSVNQDVGLSLLGKGQMKKLNIESQGIEKKPYSPPEEIVVNSRIVKRQKSNSKEPVPNNSLIHNSLKKRGERIQRKDRFNGEKITEDQNRSRSFSLSASKVKFRYKLGCPITPVDAIQEERVPLFIRQRQQNKNQNPLLYDSQARRSPKNLQKVIINGKQPENYLKNLKRQNIHLQKEKRPILNNAPIPSQLVSPQRVAFLQDSINNTSNPLQNHFNVKPNLTNSLPTFNINPNNYSKEVHVNKTMQVQSFNQRPKIIFNNQVHIPIPQSVINMKPKIQFYQQKSNNQTPENNSQVKENVNGSFDERKLQFSENETQGKQIVEETKIQISQETRVETSLREKNVQSQIYLQNQTSEKKRQKRDERNSLKRQFISKTTEVNINPVVVSHIEKEEEFYDFENRKLTKMQTSYKNKFAEDNFFSKRKHFQQKEETDLNWKKIYMEEVQEQHQKEIYENSSGKYKNNQDQLNSEKKNYEEHQQEERIQKILVKQQELQKSNKRQLQQELIKINLENSKQKNQQKYEEPEEYSSPLLNEMVRKNVSEVDYESEEQNFLKSREREQIEQKLVFNQYSGQHIANNQIHQNNLQEQEYQEEQPLNSHQNLKEQPQNIQYQAEVEKVSNNLQKQMEEEIQKQYEMQKQQQRKFMEEKLIQEEVMAQQKRLEEQLVQKQGNYQEELIKLKEKAKLLQNQRLYHYQHKSHEIIKSKNEYDLQEDETPEETFAKIQRDIPSQSPKAENNQSNLPKGYISSSKVRSFYNQSSSKHLDDKKSPEINQYTDFNALFGKFKKVGEEDMSFKKSQKYLSETLIEKKPETYSSSMEPFVDYTEIKS